METVSATYFVSRLHEHPPTSLEALLRASASRDSDGAKTDKTDDDSDSDYQCAEEEDSADDLDDGESEVDEWRLHATEPREGLYLHEMRRQRSGMDDIETQWVRGYVKAQRVWKARTGHSIDKFLIPGSTLQRRQVEKNKRHSKWRTEGEEEETNTSLFTNPTRLESLLMLAAIVFVCLSLGAQLHMSMAAKEVLME